MALRALIKQQRVNYTICALQHSQGMFCVVRLFVYDDGHSAISEMC